MYSDGTWQSFQSEMYADLNWSTWLDFGAGTIPSGNTITSAILGVYCTSSNASYTTTVKFFNQHSTAFPTDGTDAQARPLTSGTSRTYNPYTGTNHYEYYDCTADVANLPSVSGWGTTSRLMLKLFTTSPSYRLTVYSGYTGPTNPPTLDITYSAGGGSIVNKVCVTNGSAINRASFY